MAKAKDIQLHFMSDIERCEADFDKNKLEEILYNLLSNAMKFTPAGGHIYYQLTLRDNWQPLSPAGYYEELTPTSHLTNAWIQISVSDSGPGLDYANLATIFDRFYQADNHPNDLTGGTGIGLSLVRELVALMQGGLAVRNRPDQGAEFVISLPFTQQAPLSTDPAPNILAVSSEESREVQPEQLTTGNRPVLLLVEDNHDVAAYIQICLADSYQVLWAENGQAGIDIAFEKIPEVILSDVMMPMKDGLVLCDTLKNDQRTSHIPIVLLTAKAAISDRIAGLRRGADAYLVKPFGREELLLVLGNLIQTRRVLQTYYSQLALNTMQEDLAVPSHLEESIENEFLIKLRNIIEAQLDNTKLSIETLCGLMGMSRTTMHLKMTALTGMSMNRYLRALRLQKAKELLSASKLNISEIAFAVGFEDPKYFSRVFSEEFGLSPASFRSSAGK
jgi:DNA-binding response OmpR family regulator